MKTPLYVQAQEFDSKKIFFCNFISNEITSAGITFNIFSYIDNMHRVVS